MSITRRWIVPIERFTTPGGCGRCCHASECRECPDCGATVHVVEDYAPNGQCHCGRVPRMVES